MSADTSSPSSKFSADAYKPWPKFIKEQHENLGDASVSDAAIVGVWSSVKGKSLASKMDHSTLQQALQYRAAFRATTASGKGQNKLYSSYIKHARDAGLNTGKERDVYLTEVFSRLDTRAEELESGKGSEQTLGSTGGFNGSGNVTKGQEESEDEDDGGVDVEEGGVPVSF